LCVGSFLFLPVCCVLRNFVFKKCAEFLNLQICCDAFFVPSNRKQWQKYLFRKHFVKQVVTGFAYLPLKIFLLIITIHPPKAERETNIKGNQIAF
jgi:hypothetical protein